MGAKKNMNWKLSALAKLLQATSFRFNKPFMHTLKYQGERRDHLLGGNTL